jgi:hypothetical protein
VRRRQLRSPRKRIKAELLIEVSLDVNQQRE